MTRLWQWKREEVFLKWRKTISKTSEYENAWEFGERKFHRLGLPSPLQNASHNELKCAFHLITPILHGWIKYCGYSLQKINSVKKDSMVFFQCFGMEVPKLTAETYPDSTKIDCSLSLSPNTYHNKSYDGDYFYKQKNCLPLRIFPGLCSKEAVKTLRQNYFKSRFLCFGAIMFS